MSSIVNDNKNGHIEWLYFMRGLCIFAVVASHQINILHISQTLQACFLFHVTGLIFLSGITSSLYFNRHEEALREKWILNSLKRLFPVFLSYSFAVYVHTLYINGMPSRDSYNYNPFFEELLQFRTAPQFYYLEYYFAFTFLSPALYAIIRVIQDKAQRWHRIALLIILLSFSFAIGYYGTRVLHALGGSLLFVYTAGMVWGRYNCSLGKKKVVLPVSLCILAFGLYSTQRLNLCIINGTDYPFPDRLFSKLSLLPPNISVMLYTVGIVLVVGIVYELLAVKKIKPLSVLERVVRLLGKDSLDIFLWHVFIMVYLPYLDRLNLPKIPNILVRYIIMLGLPVVIRELYEYVKKKLKSRFAA